MSGEDSRPTFELVQSAHHMSAVTAQTEKAPSL